MALVQSLKALADENRMKILQILLSGDLCVGALADQLGISKPAVSQHLRVLREAGLVRGEKRGYWTHYEVDRPAIARIAAELQQLGETPRASGSLCFRIGDFPPDVIQLKEDGMCQNCCQQPDKLKDKPEHCSPQQIRECHGDVEEHPCVPGKRDPEPK